MFLVIWIEPTEMLHFFLAVYGTIARLLRSMACSRAIFSSQILSVSILAIARYPSGRMGSMTLSEGLRSVSSTPKTCRGAPTPPGNC